MDTITTTTWIPIKIPFKVPFKETLNEREVFYKYLEEFLKDLPDAIKLISSFSLSITLKLTRPTDFEINEFRRLNHLSPKDIDFFYEFLEITTAIRKKTIIDLTKGLDFKSKEDLAPALAADYVSYTMRDALILAQIAYPGWIRTGNGFTLIDRNRYNTIEAVCGFTIDTFYPQADLWPNIQTLSIRRVCEWEAKIGLLSNRVARSPLEKAVACYTLAATNPHTQEGEILFRLMQGLEAFYVKGGENIRKQLVERIKYFIGSPKSKMNFDKQINNLYDVRSRFIHGDFDIEMPDYSHEPEDADLERWERIENSISLSARILICTIQKCISNNITKAAPIQTSPQYLFDLVTSP